MNTKILLLPIAIAALSGCAETRAAKTGGSPLKASAVSTVAASYADWPERYEATGTVRARTSAIVSSRSMGYIREMKVGLGDRVREGETLIVLDTRDLDATASRAAALREEVRNGIPEADSGVEAAKANFELAQVTFRRMKGLYDQKSISDQEFDEASARTKAAQSAYEMAKARRMQIDSRLAQVDQEVSAAKIARGYAEIQAPFSGIVTVKSAEPGTLAISGAPLLTIERDGYRMEAAVEESKLALIHNGQTATVTLDGVDHPIESRVVEIVPSVDSASRSGIAKIDLPALPLVRSGMFGRAEFRTGSRRVLTVPAAATGERGQLQWVFVAAAGVARMRLVTLGTAQGAQIEVLSGLSGGEQLIAPIPENFSDGTPVEVRQ